ncbi:2-C-methyl-D-erythritol 4-phosphate cytidylyltransferase [Acidobacteriota bacterium]
MKSLHDMKGVSVIVVAAGEGKRFGDLKQLALLKGRPVLNWSLDRFEAHREVSEIILVLRGEHIAGNRYKSYEKISAITKGGKKRQDSVIAGFSLANPAQADMVLIHDGVRPLVSKELIDRIIAATRDKGAAIPVVPVRDTIKIIEEHKVLQTVDRKRYYNAQTPQGFCYDVLEKALADAKKENFYGSDEASLVERIGIDVFTVDGEDKNLKITTPEDLRIAETYLED